MKTAFKKFISYTLSLFALCAAVLSLASATAFIGNTNIAYAVSEQGYTVSENQHIANNSASVTSRAGEAPRFGNVVFDVDFSEDVRLEIDIEVFGDAVKVAEVYAETERDGLAGEDVKLKLTDGSLTGSGGAVSGGVYSAEVADYNAVTVVAKDVAGNESRYAVDLDAFDRAGIVEYYNKFISVDPDRFSIDKRTELYSAFEALEVVFESGGVSEELTAAKRAVDACLSGTIAVSVKNLSSSANVPTGISVSPIPFEATDLIVGIEANVYVDEVALSESELAARKQLAAELTGYRNAVVAAFSMKLRSGAESGEEKNVFSNVEIGLNLPVYSEIAKVFRYENGAMVPLSMNIEGNRLTFETDSFGEFYLVSERESEAPEADGIYIGDKFFPSEMLWTAGGIVAGVAVLCGVTALIVLLVKNKKSR